VCKRDTHESKIHSPKPDAQSGSRKWMLWENVSITRSRSETIGIGRGSNPQQRSNLKLATAGFKGVTEYPCISRGKVLGHSGRVQSYELCVLGKLVNWTVLGTGFRGNAEILSSTNFVVLDYRPRKLDPRLNRTQVRIPPVGNEVSRGGTTRPRFSVSVLCSW